MMQTSETPPYLLGTMEEGARTTVGRQVDEIVEQIRKGDALVNPIQVDDDADTVDNQWASVEAEYDADIAKIESIDLTQTSEEVNEANWTPLSFDLGLLFPALT